MIILTIYLQSVFNIIEKKKQLSAHIKKLNIDNLLGKILICTNKMKLK